MYTFHYIDDSVNKSIGIPEIKSKLKAAPIIQWWVENWKNQKQHQQDLKWKSCQQKLIFYDNIKCHNYNADQLSSTEVLKKGFEGKSNKEY